MSKPKVQKAMKIAPDNYYDMVGSVEKDKKIKHSEVFGKGTGKPTGKKSTAKKPTAKKSTGKKPTGKKPTGKATKNQVPKGSHRMPDGTIMKDSDMPKKNKKKQTKKKY